MVVDIRSCQLKILSNSSIISRTHAYHNCARCRGSKIPAAKFALPAGFFRFVEFAGTHDDIAAPFFHVRHRVRGND